MIHVVKSAIDKHCPPQVSTALKSTPEAQHSARVVNELSAVLHSVLQARIYPTLVLPRLAALTSKIV